MIKKTTYICGICGTEHATEDDCRKCEELCAVKGRSVLYTFSVNFTGMSAAMYATPNHHTDFGGVWWDVVGGCEGSDGKVRFMTSIRGDVDQTEVRKELMAAAYDWVDQVRKAIDSMNTDS